MTGLSWNRWPRVAHREQISIRDRNARLPHIAGKVLAYGNGRSYGDVCLNEGGTLFLMRGLNRFITFDQSTGRLRCESGVLLGEILDLVVPKGWFLPVTPGTRFVTVGGAIANDVHGKNHHRAGSFGHHVKLFELLRLDGQRILCAPDQAPEWFVATIGGLGLTGCITWAEIQLIPVANAFMRVESRRFSSLDEFWEINAEAERVWPYTVAWIDCRNSGRGIYFSADHAPTEMKLSSFREKARRLPFTPPLSLIGPQSSRIFNALYFHQPLASGTELKHYIPFFYPLDAVSNWNLIYGQKGFFQYQCVLPPIAGKDGVSRILQRIRTNGQNPFLAVLKTFGAAPSLGMLSFPRPGVTLALDFPNAGEKIHSLFKELDAIVSEAGGALYPAKDARMPSDLFRAGYPLWEKFSAYIDPAFSSGFWRRVNP